MRGRHTVARVGVVRRFIAVRHRACIGEGVEILDDNLSKTPSESLVRWKMRATGDNSHLASAVFDSHLCVAEYLLYGPTPYDEVVALARDFRRDAERTGARRAVAFAVTVADQ